MLLRKGADREGRDLSCTERQPDPKGSSGSWVAPGLPHLKARG